MSTWTGGQPKHGTKGMWNGRAKLRMKEVLFIRKVYAEGQLSQSTLAQLYGVSQGTIHKIVTGKTWKHLDGPRTFLVS